MTKEKRNRPTTGDSPLKMGSLWIQTYRLNPSKPSSQESRGFNHRSVNKYFPDGSDVSIEVGDDRAAASNSRFETVEWDIEDGIPQKLVDMLQPKAG